MILPRSDKDLDREVLADAANIVDISEFDLLRIANVKWQGEEKEGDYDKIEMMFGKFLMNRGELPSWARDFCRKVVKAWVDKDEEELKNLFIL